MSRALGVLSGFDVHLAKLDVLYDGLDRVGLLLFRVRPIGN